METKKLVCIECPRGCELTAFVDEGRVTEVTGNFCVKGKKYAEEECTEPRRVVTSTVRALSGKMLPVKTAGAVRKEKIAEVMRRISRVRPALPVTLGDILDNNIDGEGTPLVATKTIKS